MWVSKPSPSTGGRRRRRNKIEKKTKQGQVGEGKNLGLRIEHKKDKLSSKLIISCSEHFFMAHQMIVGMFALPQPST
jgi:hypothetical protein